MSNIILKQNSSSDQLKSYFTAIFQLNQAGEEFPIDLDDVWPLVYPRKDHAVRALMANFMQDVDYKVFPQKAENLNGGRPANIYKITIACMEFFIARKVRPVFEVYRQVFHKAVSEALPSYQIADPIKRAERWIEEQRRTKELQTIAEQQQRQIEADRPKTVFADAITGSTSSCLVGELAKILNQNGVPVGQNRLFGWLRANHFLGSVGEMRNMPAQRYIEQGIFEIKKSVHSQGDHMVTTSTPKVTGKGQQYFINGFLSGRFTITQQ